MSRRGELFFIEKLMQNPHGYSKKYSNLVSEIVLEIQICVQNCTVTHTIEGFSKFFNFYNKFF